MERLAWSAPRGASGPSRDLMRVVPRDARALQRQQTPAARGVTRSARDESNFELNLTSEAGPLLVALSMVPTCVRSNLRQSPCRGDTVTHSLTSGATGRQTALRVRISVDLK